MRRMHATLVFGLCLALLFCYAGNAKADSSSGNPTAVAHLDFRVTIPQIVYLQVGTVGGTTDRVTFAVTDLPGTGAVAGTSNGANPVPVRVAALVASGATVTLKADSSTALSDGASHNIPFTEISWVAGGTGGFNNGAFNGNAAQQIEQFTGSGDHQGNYTFSYANDTYYPTGTYNGTVTYTLSTP
jgi:predicted RecA/RadA family phage recombinase